MSSKEGSAPAHIILPDGRTFDLLETTNIGRGRSNSVVIDNEFIGRRHALIQVQGNGQCILVDLGSRNGCSIDNHRISSTQLLKDGDVIDMAGSRIEFHTRIAPDDLEEPGPTLDKIEKRRCWLMIGDIEGSTQMARNFPPEEIPRITGGWFNACVELIEMRGGHMNQYLGDGFCCYWDAGPKAKVQILDAMRELVRMQRKASPRFRLVLHFGEIVLSTVPNTRALNLHGDEVNFAFRTEKIAASFKDSLLCSEAALQTLGVKSLVRRESEVDGYEGVFSFHVPDLQ